jgi:hypothetical protein
MIVEVWEQLVPQRKLVASWTLPDSDVPVEASFTAPATPDARKVNTFVIVVTPSKGARS